MDYRELIDILCDYCNNDVLISKKSLYNSLNTCSAYKTYYGYSYNIVIENKRYYFSAINKINVVKKNNSLSNTIIFVNQGEDMVRILCVSKYKGSFDTIGLCSTEYLDLYINHD